jgi:tetratricopeptide (TPR) repeat protein
MAHTLTAGGSSELAMASLSEARKIFKTTPPAAPDFAMLIREEGVALQNLGDLKGAMQRLREGLTGIDAADNPALTSILWSNLGNCLDRAGQGDEALDAYEHSIAGWSRLDTEEARLQISINRRDQGSTLLKQGRRDAAVARFDEAEALLRSMPARPIVQHSMALLRAAQSQAVTGDLEEAGQVLP